MNRHVLAWILRSILAVAVLTAFSVRSLQAQVDTGSITGTVTDPSGAVVGGAKVTLTNEGTGTSLTTTTSADGVYDFSPVRIGSYKLDASASGFKKEVQTHVVVDVSARVQTNFKLQPGAITETIEAEASVQLAFQLSINLLSQEPCVGHNLERNLGFKPQ